MHSASAWYIPLCQHTTYLCVCSFTCVLHWYGFFTRNQISLVIISHSTQGYLMKITPLLTFYSHCVKKCIWKLCKQKHFDKQSSYVKLIFWLFLLCCPLMAIRPNCLFSLLPECRLVWATADFAWHEWVVLILFMWALPALWKYMIVTLKYWNMDGMWL